jgi:hypothetical protein
MIEFVKKTGVCGAWDIYCLDTDRSRVIVASIHNGYYNSDTVHVRILSPLSTFGGDEHLDFMNEDDAKDYITKLMEARSTPTLTGQLKKSFDPGSTKSTSFSTDGTFPINNL